ncbi:TPA: hypothetical protein ACIH5Z_004543, partial [Salmonella enterica subsp. enterica serovar Typhimurium]
PDKITIVTTGMAVYKAIKATISWYGFSRITMFMGKPEDATACQNLKGEPAEFGKNRTLRFSGHP